MFKQKIVSAASLKGTVAQDYASLFFPSNVPPWACFTPCSIFGYDFEYAEISESEMAEQCKLPSVITIFNLLPERP
jgi:hypothetical protein